MGDEVMSTIVALLKPFPLMILSTLLKLWVAIHSLRSTGSAYTYTIVCLFVFFYPSTKLYIYS